MELDWCHTDPPRQYDNYPGGENYGYPHVVYSGSTNCALCGAEIELPAKLEEGIIM